MDITLVGVIIGLLLLGSVVFLGRGIVCHLNSGHVYVNQPGSAAVPRMRSLAMKSYKRAAGLAGSAFLVFLFF